MSDEGATRMAAWIVDHPKSYDNYARIVARALLSREAERDAVIEECARVALRASRHYEDGGWGRAACESIAYQIQKLKTAGQPSADGGKEEK